MKADTIWNFLNLNIYPYGFFISIGFIIFFIAIYLLNKKTITNINSYLILLAVYLIPSTLILSRLVYCLCNYNYFFIEIEQPLMMFHFWDGGFAISGLFLALILSSYLASKKNKNYSAKNAIINSTFISLLLLVSLIRIGEGFTYVGIGKTLETDISPIFSFFVTTDELGFSSIAVNRIESVVSLVLFCIMVIYYLKNTDTVNSIKLPILAYISLSSYGALQLTLESLRNDGHMMTGFIHIQQLISALIPLIVIIALNKTINNTITYKHLKNNIIKHSPITPILIYILCIVFIVVLEFDIDGRISLFNGIEYLLMSAVSIILLLIPLNLYKKYLKIRSFN